MTSTVPPLTEAGTKPPRRRRKLLLPCGSGCLVVIIAIVGVLIVAAPRVYSLPSDTEMPDTPSLAEPTVTIFSSYWEYHLHPPRRGDIVVFLAPARADGEHMDPAQKVEHILVKRLIGVPGDQIQIKSTSGK